MNLLEQRLKDLQLQEASLKKLLYCSIADKNYEKADNYKYELDKTRKEIINILNELS